MKHISPTRIQRLAKEEVEKTKKINSDQRTQAIQVLKQKQIIRQVEEIDDTIDHLSGFYSNSHKRIKLPGLKSHLNFPEISPYDQSLTTQRESDSLNCNTSSLAKSDMQSSSNYTPKSRLKKNQKEIAEVSDKLTGLIKSCFINQLSNFKNKKIDIRKSKRTIQLTQRDQTDQPEDNVLRDLLSNGYDKKKADSTVQKYSLKQNKFVSYRRYRENFVEYSDNILKVFESDEK